MTDKKVTKKRAPRKPDNVYWVVLVRNYLTWSVDSLWSTEVAAKQHELDLALYNIYSKRNVKIERVELAA